MRVVIVLMNRGRGSGEIARQHVRELVALGHRVTFLHVNIGAGVAGADNRNVELHSPVTPVHEYLQEGLNQRPVSTMPAAQALAYVPDYVAALENAVAGADIILGHHANVSAVAVADVARRHHIPYVLFLHGTGIEPRLLGGYDDAVWARIDEAIRNADAILVTTEYVRDQLIRPLVDLPLDRFFVLPCGVDIDQFQPKAIGDARERYDLPNTFVICPGAVTWIKGTHNVIEASQHYAELAPTVFIGDGDLRPELESRLGERGRFLGFVSGEEKAHLINAATVLVAGPEKREHFGIIYIEALAGGTVPVAYEGGGVGTIITPGTGVLVRRDPAALGEATRDLLQHPRRMRAMGRAARLRAEEDFAADKLARRLSSWLESLIAFRP
jgi:glycosyltransferase involved in cell wall biosynthesis